MIRTPAVRLHQTMDSTNSAYFFTQPGYITLPRFNPSGSTFSVAMWILGSYKSDIEGIACHYDNHGKYQWAIASDTSGHIRFSVGDDNVYQTTLTGSVDTADADWHYIVCTYDKSYMRIYVDGVLDNSVAETRDIGYGTLPVFIGAVTYSTSKEAFILADSSYKGFIENFAFWNKALSADEVKYYMKHSPKGDEADLMCFLPFNGDMNDITTNEYDATASSGVTEYEFMSDLSGYHSIGRKYGATDGVGGVFNEAISLDGVNDYVKAYDNGDGSLDITEDVTITFWMKKDTNWDASNSVYNFLVGKGNVYDGEGYFVHLYERSADTSYRLQFIVAGSSGYDGVTSYRASDFAVDEWTHIAAVYEDETRMEIYVNGELAASSYESLTNGPAATTEPFAIGYHPGDSRHAYVDGDFDEVRVYNKALTASDIKRIMLGMHPFA